jgi:hypothetical protein
MAVMDVIALGCGIVMLLLVVWALLKPEEF